MTKPRLLLAFFLACACSYDARAAIMYTLSGQVAGPHSATGTITTDGTLGSIGTANVISSSITVTDASGSFSLLSQPVSFSNVTATATTLSFGGTGEVKFNAGSDLTHWRLRSNLLRTIRTTANGGRRADITFPHTFAGNGVAVPEPSTSLLVSASLLLVYNRRRRAH